jgi:hypothetical protein
MKMIAFWDIALCSLVGVDRHFRGVYCLKVITLMMKAVYTSMLYPKGSHLPEYVMGAPHSQPEGTETGSIKKNIMLSHGPQKRVVSSLTSLPA